MKHLYDRVARASVCKSYKDVFPDALRIMTQQAGPSHFRGVGMPLWIWICHIQRTRNALRR